MGGFGVATVVIQSSTVSPAFANTCGTRLQDAGFDDAGYAKRDSRNYRSREGVL